ncbi:SymE family type I addiction module toxin [Serratia rhizosphaerae]|uniref:SymE family type I addiction module toxin n=1 Tax=Serratia rhizosphaerae TaxID=2597702 RepID=UPI002DBE546E|nr:SymE family type I addiction module toxin [Serratia rhizosphaerae]MEB6334602.1 type I toxin-antitoxin system SymE family toxin [Serratia rhizosphaerae]
MLCSCFCVDEDFWLPSDTLTAKPLPFSPSSSPTRSIVGYRPNGGRPNPLPQLTLTGKWLEPLGFTTGQRIEVIAAPGQLIVHLAEET